MSPQHPPTAEALLAHGLFLRRLASRLVRTEEEAEDAVQDAWVAVLERHREERGPTRWIAYATGVVKRRAARRARDVVRQSARERRAARSEGQPNTADIAARLEVQRLLAEAVSRLEEPNRTTIVLRYFDDLPPRAIAERMAVPVRTVESRLRRGREAVRADLDRRGNGREAWLTAVGPWLGLDRVLQPAGTTTATVGAAQTTTGAMFGTPLAVGGTIMATKVWVLGACVVGGIGAGWLGRDMTLPAASTSSTPTDSTPTRIEGLSPRLAGASSIEAERALRMELEATNQALATKVARLEETIAAKAAQAGAPTDPGLLARGAPPHVPIPLAGQVEMLALVDWPRAGEAAHAMGPLLARYIDALAAGTNDEALAMSVGKRNMVLVNAALALMEQGLPGHGVNGAFTHPAPQVNLIHATLAAAGLPLDEKQLERLAEIGTRHMTAEAQRVASYTESTMDFVKITQESLAKQVFYDEIDAILSPAQRDVLHPPAARGWMGLDLFSPTLLWQGSTAPLTGANADAIAATATTMIVGHLGVGEADRPLVVRAVGDFIARYPAQLMNSPPSARDRIGFVHWSRLVGSFASTRQLYEDLANTLPAEGPHVDKLRRATHVFMPMVAP